MLTSVEQISNLIGSLGIGNQDHVVLIPYGTSSSKMGTATRIYWTFKVLGHDKVSILTAGWPPTRKQKNLHFQLKRFQTHSSQKPFKPILKKSGYRAETKSGRLSTMETFSLTAEQMTSSWD